MNYSRQKFTHRRQENLPEKNDNLLLKKNFESAEKNNTDNINQNLDAYNEYRDADISEDEASPPPSQNFVLHLSSSGSSTSVKEPPYRNGKNNSKQFGMEKNDNTILISESNDGASTDDSPRLYPGKKKTTRIRPTPYYPDLAATTIVIESSDSEDDRLFRANQQLGDVVSLLSEDEDVLNDLSSSKEKEKSNKRSAGSSEESKTARSSREKDSSDASDSTHFSLGSKLFEGNSGVSNRQRIVRESSSSDEEIILTNTRKNYRKTYSERSKSKKKSTSSTDSFHGIANMFANVTHRSNSICQKSTKLYDSTLKLTKKDAESILKGTKVGVNPYWTPQSGLPFSENQSESSASCRPSSNNKKIISETPSELLVSRSNSEDEIISNSSPDLKKPSKTHVSRFINPPNQEQQYGSLSEKKKREISQWLMYNTPGSSSSSSIVSESNRNSSFGNSSLERFELKHETPNNRGKISKANTLEKPNSVPKGLEQFIYKGKTSVLKNQTPERVDDLLEKPKPKSNEATPNITTNQIKSKENLPVIKSIENLQIKDCADILDKLYGNIWRNEAEAVLTPQTEPRSVKNLINGKRQSKTERKNTSKPMKENIRPNFNSIKKQMDRARNSFIDDGSLSENSSESFYHTALTDPRKSKDIPRQAKPTPISLTTESAKAICDSDSDLDYPQVLNRDFNKKRLSFSDDTSEFDPGEPVLPKPRTKKVPTKTSRQTRKPQETESSMTSNPLGKTCKSFLASLSATVSIHICHPAARIYRDDYKNKKEELCKYLFQLYNKEIFDEKLPSDMAIEWNVRMRGTAGFCYNKKTVKALGGIARSSRIVLATKILDTPDRLRDTLVHEMCHAAAWLINNVSDGHGPFWKGWASKAIKTFPELPPIRRCHDYKIKTKFTYRCTKCGYSIGRHSKSLNIETKRCGYCYGKFELLVNRTTRSGTTQISTPAVTRAPSGFALYVKKNYHSVKKSRRSMKHAEVMKILSQQFTAVKDGRRNSSTNEVKP